MAGRREKGEAENPQEMVALSGPPAEVGALWGRINADSIANDLNTYYLKPAAAEALARDALLKRSERFIEIAGRMAPHWLEEAEAVAEAAGVDERLYLSFVASGYRSLFLHPECTSYTVNSRYTGNHAIFFHKNRDNVEKSQSAFVMNSSLPGINRFIAVSDASVIACMMMVNEKGLAGSADTGGLRVDRPRYRGLMNTSILRFIAEKAGSCQEALGIVEAFVSEGQYAGGAKTGTHWLFVDRSGAALEISNNSERVAHVYHGEKVYFSARGDSVAAEKLRQADRPVDFGLFHSVSRDASVCFPSSIAGMTVEIDERRPDLLSCAWISLPARALSVPLFMGQRRTPLALLDGELYWLSKSASCKVERWARQERSAYQGKLLLHDEIDALSEAGRREASMALLERWSQKQTEAHLALLRALQ